MYPKLTIDINKLKSNLDGVAKIVKDEGNATLMIVTKGLCADEKMTDMVAEHPAVDYMADSRMKNIKTYAEKAHKNEKETLLLRLPMACEIQEVITYADVSFNLNFCNLATSSGRGQEAG